jgi:hypothetical protein
MTSRTLSNRLARLETRLMPATKPLVYEVQFISAEDGSVTSRLQLGGNRRPAGGPASPSRPTLPGRSGGGAWRRRQHCCLPSQVRCARPQLMAQLKNSASPLKDGQGSAVISTHPAFLP